MMKTKVKVKKDIKTPAMGLLSVALMVLCFVFFCEITIVFIRLLIG